MPDKALPMDGAYTQPNARTRTSILIVIGLLAVGACAYLIGVYFLTDDVPSERLMLLYRFIIVVLSAWYVVLENRERRYVYEPYELGMLIWIAWPVYLPYYLFRSRGLKGILMFLGLLVLVFLDWIVSLLWYALGLGDA